MNYEEAVAYIDETPKFTKKNSLDHTKECLRRLGNPQDKFKVIHVAGTNGKGSTCAFLTSVLREAGYSCGLFTSPHLVEINERFQINEVNIDNDTFLKAFEKVKVLADELVAEGSYHPTYFEMLFLMGMVIFAEAGVDYVTLETGLGGRMDATTAVENPVACVITSISLDHMQYLGDTVAKIAGEKCCRGRDRTSTGQLVVAQSSVVDPGRSDFHRNGSMLYLSCYPHPRDKRACLPKISSPHSIKN